MLLSRHDIQLCVIGKLTKRGKQQEQQMNRLKSALCNTHHNSTIETNLHGKMGKFPSQRTNTETDIF